MDMGDRSFNDAVLFVPLAMLHCLPDYQKGSRQLQMGRDFDFNPHSDRNSVMFPFCHHRPLAGLLMEYTLLIVFSLFFLRYRPLALERAVHNLPNRIRMTYNTDAQ